MRFPISLKIMALLTGLSCVIIGSLTYNYYTHSYAELEEKYAIKLRHIALTAAVGISGEDHEAISGKGDHTRPEFQRIYAHLKQIKKVNGLSNETIYTFRAVSNEQLKFCVMLHPKPFIGDIYKVPMRNRVLVEEVLKGKAMSTGIYVDKHGHWISGMAPIRDTAGRVRGILQVDNEVHVFIAELNESVRRIVFISLAVLLGGLFIGYLIARAISGPLKELKEASDLVRKGKYDVDVRVNTKDEIADLAVAFSTMTNVVRERTRVLQHTLWQLTGILDNMVDGLLALDTDMLVLRHNPALLELLDEKDAVWEHRPFPAARHPELAEMLERCRVEGGVVTAEISLSKDLTGKATVSPLVKEGGDKSDPDARFGYLVLLRDITRETEIDRMKTEFISNVSHELRTPLTSVLGFAKLIKKKLDDVIFPLLNTEEKKTGRAVRQVDDNIAIIVSEGERLTNLINDVLDIAKMEAGKLDWKMEELSVNEIIERGMAATNSLLENNPQVELCMELATDLPVLTGDHDRILQVVINLISNALKFTDTGSVTLRSFMNEREEIVVAVLDTGTGISAEDRPKVFEKFKQVGDTLTDKPKGTGLGLPICKQIVEYHGGRISVEANEPRGSVFSFTLPLAAGKRVRTEAMDMPALVERLKQESREKKGEQRKSILVVDDEDNIRALLHQELEAAGYAVREAANGLAAIESVKNEKPDLIILDVMMPKLSGFDTAAILKNDPVMMDIPIIILSIVQDRERGLHIGVDRYLNKPIDTPALLDDIKKLLEQGVSSKRVMVIDEDQSTLRALADLLAARGHQVVQAVNAGEGIRTARDTRPDMIIIGSLRSDNIDVVRALKFEKELEHALFFVLGDSREDNQDDAP